MTTMLQIIMVKNDYYEHHPEITYFANKTYIQWLLGFARFLLRVKEDSICYPYFSVY